MAKLTFDPNVAFSLSLMSCSRSHFVCRDSTPSTLVMPCNKDWSRDGKRSTMFSHIGRDKTPLDVAKCMDNSWLLLLLLFRRILLHHKPIKSRHSSHSTLALKLTSCQELSP